MRGIYEGDQDTCPERVISVSKPFSLIQVSDEYMRLMLTIARWLRTIEKAFGVGRRGVSNSVYNPVML